MYLIALKMLMGDRGRFFGILVGISFASLLITQQAAIYTGIMHRTKAFFQDTAGPDIWVMDETVDHVDDINPLSDKELFRVRGVEGVDWAVPMYRGSVQLNLPGGNQKKVWLVGVDDATLFGAPPNMVQGSIEDLREADAIILTTEGIEKLMKETPEGMAPVEVGDVLEVDDHRAVVVGFAATQRTIQQEPTAYTTYSRALQMAPTGRKMLTFVLVKVREGEDPNVVAARISELSGLKALTGQQFADLTYNYWYKFTAIPENFGTAVLLGFIVGTAIAGQLFYTFVLDNLKFLGTFKAMGAGNITILMMILLQAALAGAIGYGLGVGAASIFGWAFGGGRLSFRLEWTLLVLSAISVVTICVTAALFSMRQVLRLSPAEVFRE